jgi:hypothetical protein
MLLQSACFRRCFSLPSLARSCFRAALSSLSISRCNLWVCGGGVAMHAAPCALCPCRLPTHRGTRAVGAAGDLAAGPSPAPSLKERSPAAARPTLLEACRRCDVDGVRAFVRSSVRVGPAASRFAADVSLRARHASSCTYTANTVVCVAVRGTAAPPRRHARVYWCLFVVVQLRDGAAVNERDRSGSTPLIHASWHATPSNNGLAVIELLVAAGADVNVRRYSLSPCRAAMCRTAVLLSAATLPSPCVAAAPCRLALRCDAGVRSVAAAVRRGGVPRCLLVSLTCTCGVSRRPGALSRRLCCVTRPTTSAATRRCTSRTSATTPRWWTSCSHTARWRQSRSATRWACCRSSCGRPCLRCRCRSSSTSRTRCR